MSDRLTHLEGGYADGLRKFCAVEEEADLERAYALGRTAMADGLGVLDMARVHQKALEALLATVPRAGQSKVLSAAEVFFLEALSPFEATHRGFRETNAKLHQLILAQEKRNEDLAQINRQLTEEIRGRKRTEVALRRSEGHFRKLFKEARAMQESLRNLSNQILDVQEEERRRISRELHDETGQALTAISVTLASLGRPGQSLQRQRQMLRDAQNLLQATMETLHDFARQLRPALLDELGLLHALRSYLASFADRTGLQIHFHATPAAERLGPGAKLALFRVAQESLTNVAKHAGARRVDFDLRRFGRSIRMVISDDGKSFRAVPETSSRATQRLGLLGMQERVRLVNGRFAIRPQFGRGTTVYVTVPLQTASADGEPRTFSDKNE